MQLILCWDTVYAFLALWEKCTHSSQTYRCDTLRKIFHLVVMWHNMEFKPWSCTCTWRAYQGNNRIFDSVDKWARWNVYMTLFPLYLVFFLSFLHFCIHLLTQVNVARSTRSKKYLLLINVYDNWKHWLYFPKKKYD